MDNQPQPQPPPPPISNHPNIPFMGSTKFQLVKHQGFWYRTNIAFTSIPNLQNHFHARATDILIASTPKTGTTWLKALLFAIVNRSNIDQKHLLTNHNPHELVYNLDRAYGSEQIGMKSIQPEQLDELPSPRLLQTHFPFSSLGKSIGSLTCKIVYIARNPLDTLVSQWHFFPHFIKKLTGDDGFKAPCLEDYFEDFFQGTVPYGPFFDHVLEYWKLSLERPDKVLFLKYEDLKDDTNYHLKRLADFVGSPFSIEEENKGVIEEIIQLCSLKNMKDLEVNKSGKLHKALENKFYFRKGEVGDWTNHFTPDMVEKMKKLMEEKFKDTGLSFKMV